jgi:hypothetical protein
MQNQFSRKFAHRYGKVAARKFVLSVILAIKPNSEAEELAFYGLVFKREFTS